MNNHVNDRRTSLLSRLWAVSLPLAQPWTTAIYRKVWDDPSPDGQKAVPESGDRKGDPDPFRRESEALGVLVHVPGEVHQGPML